MEKTGVSAIVEYDYTAKETDELTLKKGAIITNIKIQPGGWWEGTLTATGRTGMFPDNFVRVLEPDDKNPVVLRDKTAAQNRKCKVIYSYRENKADELTLAVGDIIEIFEEVEEGWWRGKLNGKVGVFPSNFVEEIESASPTSANRKSSTGSKPTALDGSLVGGLSKNNSLNKSRSSLNSSREDLDSVPAGLQNQQHTLPDAPSLPPKPVRELCRVLFAYTPANDDELKLVEGDIITILSKDLLDKGWWKGELRGKVGVFPDNFVVALPPEVSPIKELFHGKPERPPPAGKILINKPHTTGGQPNNAYRKESFGSKDSLNDSSGSSGTMAASGSPTFGNVAAHRKSLETRKVENSPIAGTTATAPVTEKPPRKSLDNKTSEIRKSLESLDEKKSTPPPVLGKKPQVPIKKSPSITSVTNNLFSGLKQKVKGSDNKPTTGQDSMDGAGGSRIKSEVADNNEKNISGERLSRDESEFNHVERGSVLKDMRANRAKAPKRRPPTSAGSIIGDSTGSNGMSNGNSGLFQQLSQSTEPESPKPDLLNVSHHNSNNNEDEFIAKPKAREWEKHKVPWMDELKANQAKKTSPNVSESKSPEHHSNVANSNHQEEHKFDNISKSFHINSSSAVSSTVTASGRTRLSERAATTGTADVTCTSTTTTNNSHNNHSSFDLIASSRKETSSHQHLLASTHSVDQTSSSSTNNVMTKSMSALSTKIAIPSDSGSSANNTNETSPAVSNNRPVSVNLRNRSISPTPTTRNTKTIHITSPSGGQTDLTGNKNGTCSGATTTTAIGPAGTTATLVPITNDNVCSRVQDLEAKVNRMEKQLITQNNLIDALRQMLRDECDKVKTLQKELEKYAQCVTQV
ncbi:CD2-associated protein-like isoform X2 [Sabethes cyaneus]|uniref:CD2-associated protein-like isoform X2 n=1 Tax=Sabethes cyaneus TaxID=53552 RepID=UPI00237ECCC2|nr:CD2-associated protein-like isoform X2 [Sabethes cyaneus]